LFHNQPCLYEPAAAVSEPSGPGSKGHAIEAELDRDLGFVSVLAIGVGTMIAAGIFTLSGLVPSTRRLARRSLRYCSSVVDSDLRDIASARRARSLRRLRALDRAHLGECGAHSAPPQVPELEAPLSGPVPAPAPCPRDSRELVPPLSGAASRSGSSGARCAGRWFRGFMGWKGAQIEAEALPGQPSRVALEQTDAAEADFRSLVPLAHAANVDSLIDIASVIARARNGAHPRHSRRGGAGAAPAAARRLLRGA
jgi:hypothetical protein